MNKMIKNMLRNIGQMYIEEKYNFYGDGIRYSIKPPLGYCNWLDVSIFEKFQCWLHSYIWKFDKIIDDFSGQERREKWLNSFKLKINK